MAKAGLLAGILIIIIGAVALFIGLFAMDLVANITAIDNSSDFYDTYNTTVNTTGTIFQVLGLVLIIVGLAMALTSLKSLAD